jgi:predicted O-methyltransferase YrrM
MANLLEKLGRITFARIWRLATHPSVLHTTLTAPPSTGPVNAAVALCADLDRETAETWRREFLMDGNFFSALDRGMVERRGRRATWRPWYELFYILVRHMKPSVVVETGVFDGQSSAVILQALEHNGAGTLVSIDLPATDAIEGSTHRMTESSLPRGCDPGWIVPDFLRSRYRLTFGDARILLPEILTREYPEIDVFFHDSLHTYEHQYFEYAAAWPHLRKGGLLLSDDVFWSAAFPRFCKEQHVDYVRVGGFGAARRP